VRNKAVAQLFIENSLSKKSLYGSLFASHPPIEKRIEVLEQF
jgi:heat shock protein HtpX